MDNITEARQYTSSFYKGHEKGSYNSAQAVLPHLKDLFNPKSVIDVGCGIGLWLKVWKDELGVADITGIEGDYVNAKMLNIPAEYVRIHDLKLPFDAQRKYDLAMSMEVAEHLPEGSADQFIKTLTSLSDVVLFSAALIGQEGTYHLNEQMPEYWAALFKKYGYVPVDFVRPLIWNRPEVMYWYKQNALLFVKEDTVATLPEPVKKALATTDASCLLRIHPDQYFKVYNRRNLKDFVHYRLYRIKKFFKER